MKRHLRAESAKLEKAIKANLESFGLTVASKDAWTER